MLTGLDIKTFASRDEEEVAGYAETMETIFANWEEIALTENHIKQLHRDLLQYSSKDERHRGEYKTHNNHVEAFGPDGESIGIVFETATPFDTPRLMTELSEWTQDNLENGELAQADRHRGFCCGFPRNSPVPGWQWTAFTYPDNTLAAPLQAMNMCPTVRWKASSSRARMPTT